MSFINIECSHMSQQKHFSCTCMKEKELNSFKEMCYVLICPGDMPKCICNAERSGDGRMGGEGSNDNTV